MSKKCTPLWREAHFQVKMYKTHQLRTTFGSWDVEKVHAVVARSTFRSENVQSTPPSDHFWKLRCPKSARRCGAKHISKWKCTKHTILGPLLEVEMSKKCTPLWREAHFEVKMYKTHHSRTTFGSWDVQKVHAVVARSRYCVCTNLPIPINIDCVYLSCFLIHSVSMYRRILISWLILSYLVLFHVHLQSCGAPLDTVLKFWGSARCWAPTDPATGARRVPTRGGVQLWSDLSSRWSCVAGFLSALWAIPAEKDDRVVLQRFFAADGHLVSRSWPDGFITHQRQHYHPAC